MRSLMPRPALTRRGDYAESGLLPDGLIHGRGKFSILPVDVERLPCLPLPTSGPRAGEWRRKMFTVVCGSVEIRRFRNRAEAEAFCRSWTKYGANARVVVS